MPPKRATMTSLEGVELGDLQRELHRREKAARTLLAKRASLVAKVEELDRTMSEMGISAKAGVGPVVRAPRAKNDMSLIEALQKLLKGKEMGIPDIVPALPSIGYVSNSPNLRTMVNASLLKRELFKRVGRGIYTAK